MSGVDVAAFLLARGAEDEGVARRAEESPGSYRGHPAGTAPVWTVSAASAYGRALGPRGSVEATPGRVLAECAAKRAIVAKYERASHQADHDDADLRDVWDEIASTLEQVLMLLAKAFADHPDFRAEWAVSP